MTLGMRYTCATHSCSSLAVMDWGVPQAAENGEVKTKAGKIDLRMEKTARVQKAESLNWGIVAQVLPGGISVGGRFFVGFGIILGWCTALAHVASVIFLGVHGTGSRVRTLVLVIEAFVVLFLGL
ncbi:hypothetical protein DFH07DRAFT_767177 [Mycena maculata]|uniref:Uncharacterized protein n=1 Tax=Mycena maculata TaxID=230809 RepID=A0AAD7NSV7_9AGAR|nr:hypothetical protein DFH07DRAFT_767177 [Mycena maculata]